QGMYYASKHAVHDFTDALRMELENDNAPVVVTLVKPGAINTPFPLHARNYSPVAPKPPEPMYGPEVVAEVILHCAEVAECEMCAGGMAKAHATTGALMPRITEWIRELFHIGTQKPDRPNDRQDTLETPAATLQERGTPPQQTQEGRTYNWLALRPMMTA